MPGVRDADLVDAVALVLFATCVAFDPEARRRWSAMQVRRSLDVLWDESRTVDLAPGEDGVYHAQNAA